MTLIVVSIAGSLGAMTRYVVSGWAQARFRSDFPVGTLTVNVAGSFALGLTIGAGSLESSLTMASVGFLGGFTTFSTWMVETIRLGTRSGRALGNLVLALVLGLFAAALGFVLTG